MVGWIQVYNFIQIANIPQQRIDPFYYSTSMQNTISDCLETIEGVDVRPHKGFETVTICLYKVV